MADSAVTQAPVGLQDDLKTIHGISVKVQERLNEAGITTYTQLAEAAPGELLSALKRLRGYSLERIRNEDWAGQARRQARERRPHSQQTPAIVAPATNLDENNHLTAADHLPYASFMLQFTKDQDGLVRRITVYNIQRREENKRWTAWEPAELATFFEHSGRLALTPSRQPALALPRGAAEGVQNFPGPAARSAAQGKITVLDWRMIAGDHLLKRLVVANQPFDFEMDIYFNQEQFPPGEPLRCEVNLYARSTSGGERFTIGRSEETIYMENAPDEAPGDEVHTVRVGGILREAGMYRLEAVTLVRPAAAALSPKRQAAGFLEGVLVQTYKAG